MIFQTNILNFPAQTIPSATSSYVPSLPNRNKGGWSGHVLLALLLATGGLGGAMVRFHKSPQQICNRLVHYVSTALAPCASVPFEGTPALASTTAVDTALAPDIVAATPVPNRVATSIFLNDAIGFLIEHPGARPRQVDLLVTTQFELMALDTTKGRLRASPGTKVTLLNVAADYVDVAFGEGTKRLPIASTDLAILAPEAIKAYEARLEAKDKTIWR